MLLAPTPPPHQVSNQAPYSSAHQRMHPVKLLPGVGDAAQQLLQALQEHAAAACEAADAPFGLLQAMASGECESTEAQVVVDWLVKVKEEAATTRRLAKLTAALFDGECSWVALSSPHPMCAPNNRKHEHDAAAPVPQAWPGQTRHSLEPGGWPQWLAGCGLASEDAHTCRKHGFARHPIVRQRGVYEGVAGRTGINRLTVRFAAQHSPQPRARRLGRQGPTTETRAASVL